MLEHGLGGIKIYTVGCKRTLARLAGWLRKGSWPALMHLMDQVLRNRNSTVAVLSSVTMIYVLGTERCQGASGTVSAVKLLRCHSNF